MLRRSFAVLAFLALLLGFAASLLLPRAQTSAAPAPFRKPAPKTITNSLGMKLVRIEPGKFTMGSPATEQNRGGDEQQHEVEITKAFYLGVYEVTQKEYEKVIGKNPSHFRTARDASGAALDTSDFPVEQVSWNDCILFCQKLSDRAAEKAARRVYRLPTEAEWEYACRARTNTTYYPGATLSKEQANFNHALGRTCKVGSYKPNAFGLFDMHGNVYEWCQDRHGSDYYPKSPKKDPKGPETGDSRIYRGGNYASVPQYCRSAYRNQSHTTATYTGVGLRVACDLSP